MSFTLKCLALTLLLLFHAHSSPTPSSFTSDRFETWCQEHGKTYPSHQEKLHRFQIFQHNYAYITHHNSMSNSSSYTLSLNAFADLTHQEFKDSRLGLLSVPVNAASKLIRLNRSSDGGSGLLRDPPASLDWRTKAAVTPVKDQGNCGSCWAFSATGAIEGINRIATGSLVSLSEHELIDCDWTYNSGCGGGLMELAFLFVLKNKGIDTEDDYPYRAIGGWCHQDKLDRHVVTIDGYTNVPEKDEEKLFQAVATQPVSVGISGSNLQFYSKGIYSGPCSTTLDHGVLIVGYDSKDGVDYWIVKNSWGQSWGMDGYIHMARNTGNPYGVCGINMLASYPTKSGPNPPTPPPSGWTQCNLFQYCSSVQTCCCGQTFLGICLWWNCCEFASTVCCEDRQRCCPSDYPICDTTKNQCLRRTGNFTIVKELMKKGGSGMFRGLRFLLEQLHL